MKTSGEMCALLIEKEHGRATAVPPSRLAPRGAEPQRRLVRPLLAVGHLGGQTFERLECMKAGEPETGLLGLGRRRRRVAALNVGHAEHCAVLVGQRERPKLL